MKNSRHIDLKAIAYEAMERYGFEAQFSRDVVREVEALGEEIVFGKASSGARDLRSLLWSSIDNPDSLDLDQLEYCAWGEGGEILVKVAIADVDSYVRKSSQSDRHAANNGSSIYTGVVVYPMLHERLSYDLTSLRPGVDRLAVVIAYAVLPGGDIRHGSISRAIVCNKAKLNYDAVGDWLEGVGPMPGAVTDVEGLEAQLHLQDEASERLRRYRVMKGTLELDTIEAKPVIRDDIVHSIVVERKNRARSLIENFMVAANETMVVFLEAAGVPVIQRVVRTPRNWAGIMEVASQHGARLPLEPDNKALSEFLDKRRIADPLRFPDLSLTIVKLLGAGEYMVLAPGGEHEGHFCLAIMDYTHSTAPNRRYVDVIMQRLLKAVLDSKSCPYSLGELAEQSLWLSEREKESKKVERFMRKAAAAAMLTPSIGKSFDAIVTGASEKGTYVRLLAPPAEGRVIRGERGMRVGDKVRVRLVNLDPYKGYIDFERG